MDQRQQNDLLLKITRYCPVGKQSPFTVLTVDSLLGRIFRNLTEGREPFKVEPRTSCISGRICNNKINVLYSLSEGQGEYTWMVMLSRFPKISCFPTVLAEQGVLC